MWTIHRVESVGDDLTVYARDLDGGRLPPGAARMAAEKVLSANLGIPRLGRASPRRLTADEQRRERAEATGREELLVALAAGARRETRGDYDRVLNGMRGHRETASFAAIDFPGCGWGANGVIDTQLPLEG